MKLFGGEITYKLLCAGSERSECQTKKKRCSWQSHIVCLRSNCIRNKREIACVSQTSLKMKKVWLLTRLCNTGCASSAQKRKTDFLSKVMTDSASSCCFCHGSSWFQTGMPDLPSITTTSRQGKRYSFSGCSGIIITGVSFHWHGLCCSLPWLATQWPVPATEMGTARSREWLPLPTQPPSLCCYCPLCLLLFYLFFPVSSLCLQHEVQSLISTEVTQHRLAVNLDKETFSPTSEKQELLS